MGKNRESGDGPAGRVKDKKYFSTMGLYIGVICGAAVMIIAGGAGFRTVADLSLIFGICAGPSIGYVFWRRYEKKSRESAEIPDSSDRQGEHVEQSGRQD